MSSTVSSANRGRPGGPVGVGPVPPDEVAVPVEHGPWRHQERAPPLTRDEAGEQGDERPVGPAEAWPPDLASEHRQLVAQDEDLGVLREGTRPVGPDEPEHPTEELVERPPFPWRRRVRRKRCQRCGGSTTRSSGKARYA
jgi:hypothetical protein